MKRTLVVATCAAILLAGCNNDTGTPAEQTAQTPTATGALPTPATVALGLTEAQLLDADLYTTDGTDLGEVASLLRGPEGRVDRLLIEVENSDPDRHVEISAQGLTVLKRGDDTDLVTTMTAAQFAALPDAAQQTN